MADLYIDHNVALHIAQALRRHGHNVATVPELRAERAKDDEQLLVAAQQGRILVTHDVKDFRLLHDAWRRWSRAWRIAPQHSGILIIPQAPQWSFEQAAQEVDQFLRTGQPLPNELYEWRSTSGSRRQ